MRTVHEVSRISGVSVRTLHHYDAIGLLRPSAVTDAGYRLYDDAALQRLQSILLFRELQFPLAEIRRILDDPHFDRRTALAEQQKLLELQRQRLDRLIALACELTEKGENTMSFSAFDKSELEQYAAEAKQRWGDTAAWRENAQKGAAAQQAGDGLMALLAGFGRLVPGDPASAEAQRMVAELQRYISEHFYTCTPEILRGLGQMYTGDERFRRNIDGAAVPGTADFVSRAIAVYCA